MKSSGTNSRNYSCQIQEFKANQMHLNVTSKNVWHEQVQLVWEWAAKRTNNSNAWIHVIIF